MGKGAFRGSLHFCGQARQSARTRSKRPFPASRRRGSGDRPPHFPAGRQAEGVPAFIRSPAFGPTDTRIGIRLPSRLPDKQTRALSGRHAPRVFGRPGHRRPTLIRQQPARPRASLRTRLTRQTGTPPPHPDSPTTRTAASAAYTRRRTRIGTAVSGAGHARNPLPRPPHAGRGRPKKSKNRAYIFVFVCHSNS